MPAAYLLDLTRLIRRAGLGTATGIDRVERAYLERLLGDPAPLFLLVRTTLGFVLLDRAGAEAIRARLAGECAWGPADLLGQLSQRQAPMRARAEADLRRLRLARALPAGLGRMLRRHLPAGTVYLNVGHSDLSGRVFAAAKSAGGRIAVMVHDVIPLDHPELSAPGMPQAFGARMARVAAAADLVIYPSAASRRAAEAHFARLGRVPAGVVAPLGVEIAAPEPAALPDGTEGVPYFVALGTIEPRKNLALLLELWAEIGRAPPPRGAPRLYIVGRRGWAEPELLTRLDALAQGGPGGGLVRELGPLPDGATAALMRGAAALLFPSLAEGYGLPPLEAAALGVPVVCNDLPVYRETLGDYPVYAPAHDRYLWRQAINDLALGAGPEAGAVTARKPALRAPSWSDHFKPVLRLL